VPARRFPRAAPGGQGGAQLRAQLAHVRTEGGGPSPTTTRHLGLSLGHQELQRIVADTVDRSGLPRASLTEEQPEPLGGERFPDVPVPETDRQVPVLAGLGQVEAGVPLAGDPCRKFSSAPAPGLTCPCLQCPPLSCKRRRLGERPLRFPCFLRPQPRPPRPLRVSDPVPRCGRRSARSAAALRRNWFLSLGLRTDP
jgi:hypothetical protein